MILTWITVDSRQVAGQAPPEGLSSLLSPGLLIVISTSQLLLKTSIKFYNGSHLWFNINRALQRKIENSNERKVLGNYPINRNRPRPRFIFLEINQPPPTQFL